MKRLALVALAAAFAVPAASAANSFTVRGGGWVVDTMATGSIAQFSVNFKAGPTHKLVYTDGGTGIRFYSLNLASLSFRLGVAKIMGVGMVNGKRVNFTAVIVDRPASKDTFKLAWNHGASHGGTVMDGNIKVTQITLG
jgi:hypothetical protein